MVKLCDHILSLDSGLIHMFRLWYLFNLFVYNRIRISKTFCSFERTFRLLCYTYSRKRKNALNISFTLLFIHTIFLSCPGRYFMMSVLDSSKKKDVAVGRMWVFFSFVRPGFVDGDI